MSYIWISKPKKLDNKKVKYLFKKIMEINRICYTKLIILKDKEGKDLLEKKRYNKWWCEHTKKLDKNISTLMMWIKIGPLN